MGAVAAARSVLDGVWDRCMDSQGGAWVLSYLPIQDPIGHLRNETSRGIPWA